MKNYDESVRINPNPNCPYIPDHPYRILIIDGSRTGKDNPLLNLIRHQLPDIDKIYLYAKNPFETKSIRIKVSIPINGKEKVGIEIVIF